jgi:hypothetical protein
LVFLHHPRLDYGARDYIDLGFGIGIDELLGGKDEHVNDHAHKEQLHLDFLFLTINIDLNIQQHQAQHPGYHLAAFHVQHTLNVVSPISEQVS